ncbi:hypothetical protein [Corynebacterium singulare]|uniref:hypothetical protein n=1 Tax=Corynebacterium singulare TaxID=161899 RepID=UPI0016423D23|nr:hypothetical protein [Corynebacterium singulare]
MKEECAEKLDGDYMKGFHLSPLIDAHPGTVIDLSGFTGHGLLFAGTKDSM